MKRHPVEELARRCFGDDAIAIPFQREVYDHIAAGNSVILQAPTGAGKTFAALAPFALGGWGKQNGPPAQKLIYSLPLRVLSGSLKDQYEGELKDLKDLRFTAQYGGAANDPFLHGGDLYWKPKNGLVRPGQRHAVFTTIDQTLSGFLGTPLGVPYRLANMLYGSVLSGALVFDEFHLLEPAKSFRTALSLLQKSPWPVLIMTATMSTSLRGELSRILDAREVIVTDEDLPLIHSQHETVKHLHVDNCPLDGRRLADRLGGRTLVICNTVRRAQQVYGDLCRELEKRGDARQRMLLHSRFLPKDRVEKESLIATWFGKHATESAILVATQVIEAGLDISCDIMHTEISPIDSFLQRIGRAARFADEREAEIYVYALEAMVGEGSFKPYDKETVLNTFEHLGQRSDLRFEHVQDLIDEILTESHIRIIEEYEAGRQELEYQVHRVRINVDKAALKSLVRDVDNVEVIVAEFGAIADAPVSPYGFPAVSVPVSTLYRFFKEEGVAHVVESHSDEMDRYGSKYFTIAPLDQSELRQGLRLIVSPEQAAYDMELGLRLGEPGTCSFEPSGEEPTWIKYKYERETYLEHIQRLYDQHEVRRASIAALHRLSASPNHPKIQINDPERVIHLVIWAHDLAKLTDGWQAACGNEDPPLAHGGRLPGVSAPPHAAEGTFVAKRLLMRLLSQAGESYETCVAALAAIRTHHGPKTKALSTFRIDRKRQVYLRNVTPALHGALAEDILSHWDDLMWTNTMPDDDPDWREVTQDADPILALLIYMLRRSDQLATSVVSSTSELPATRTTTSTNML